MTMIQDGVGSGRSAGVNVDNRLATAGINSPLVDLITYEGLTFDFDTGQLTLTSTGESGLLYIKNTAPEYLLVIDRVWAGIGKSTGGNPGNVVVKIYQNPSTGTLISGASVITPGNRNFGITTPAQALSYVGTEGSTITNGAVVKTLLLRDLYDEERQFGFMLPTGTSMAISVTPPASNTSMKVTLTAVGVFVDPGDFEAGGG